MDAHNPLGLPPLVKGGDVGKADEGLGRYGLAHRRAAGCSIRPPWGRQFWQEPHGAVAAAGAKNGAFGAIREEFVQLGEAALIVACQVPMALKDSGVVLNAIAFGNDGDAGLE